MGNYVDFPESTTEGEIDSEFSIATSTATPSSSIEEHIIQRSPRNINRRSTRKSRKSIRFLGYQVKESTFVTFGEDEDGNSMVNEYSILSNLGEGAYSEVKLCVNADNQPFAVKIVNKSLVKSVRFTTEDSSVGGDEFISAIQKECNILKSLQHPNIVKLIEIIDDPQNDKIFLIMEYVQKGPVWKPGMNVIDEVRAKSYMRDILSGLDYRMPKCLQFLNLKRC